MKNIFAFFTGKNNRLKISLLMLLLMVLGAFFASIVATNAGTVSITNISFYGSAGNLITANLFVPSSATRATPAPGVLAIHGGHNNKDFYTNLAIELARRGYVVLAIDASGCGGSEGV